MEKMKGRRGIRKDRNGGMKGNDKRKGRERKELERKGRKREGKEQE